MGSSPRYRCSDRSSARGRREWGEPHRYSRFLWSPCHEPDHRKGTDPYPDDLVIVTKGSARRGEDGSWIPAFSREDLTAAIHDNLRNLGLDVIDVVNLRSMFSIHEPAEGSIEAPLTVLANLSKRVWCVISGLATSRLSRLRKLDGSLRSSAYRTTTTSHTGPTILHSGSYS